MLFSGGATRGTGASLLIRIRTCSPSLLEKRAEVRCDWLEPPLRSHANLGRSRGTFFCGENWMDLLVPVVINPASCEGGLSAGNCNPQLPDDGKESSYLSYSLHMCDRVGLPPPNSNIYDYEYPFITCRSSRSTIREQTCCSQGESSASYNTAIFTVLKHLHPSFELHWAQKRYAHVTLLSRVIHIAMS